MRSSRVPVADDGTGALAPRSSALPVPSGTATKNEMKKSGNVAVAGAKLMIPGAACPCGDANGNAPRLSANGEKKCLKKAGTKTKQASNEGAAAVRSHRGASPVHSHRGSHRPSKLPSEGKDLS